MLLLLMAPHRTLSAIDLLQTLSKWRNGARISTQIFLKRVVHIVKLWRAEIYKNLSTNIVRAKSVIHNAMMEKKTIVKYASSRANTHKVCKNNGPDFSRWIYLSIYLYISQIIQKKYYAKLQNCNNIFFIRTISFHMNCFG